MRTLVFAAYFIWVGWLIRKSGADETVSRRAALFYDALIARAVQVAAAERSRLAAAPAVDLTKIDPARVTGEVTSGR